MVGLTKEIMEQSERATLLEKAKRDYPVGTRFIAVNTKQECVITTAIFRITFCNGINEYSINNELILTNCSFHCIRDDSGQWAEILPQEKEENTDKEGVHRIGTSFKSVGDDSTTVFTSPHEGRLFVLPDGSQLDLIDELKSQVSRLQSENKALKDKFNSWNEDTEEAVLTIIQTNYALYKGSNEAELHASEQIVEYFKNQFKLND